MFYVYVGTRTVSAGINTFTETFVSKNEAEIYEKMCSFSEESVKNFVKESEPEEIVSMTYLGGVEELDYEDKVQKLSNMCVNDILENLSKKDIVTIYANLYDDEEIIAINSYDKYGEEIDTLFSNERVEIEMDS